MSATAADVIMLIHVLNFVFLQRMILVTYAANFVAVGKSELLSVNCCRPIFCTVIEIKFVPYVARNF